MFSHRNSISPPFAKSHCYVHDKLCCVSSYPGTCNIERMDDPCAASVNLARKRMRGKKKGPAMKASRSATYLVAFMCNYFIVL